LKTPEKGDWKVARTRRLESLRYLQPPVSRFASSVIEKSFDWCPAATAFLLPLDSNPLTVIYVS
jgi:hypothetical protein